MNLSTADRINSLIDNIRSAEVLRAGQRALLNGFFNGDRPWTDKEAEQNHILINFNDKSGQTLLHQARGQYENGFLKSSRFFKVEVDAPAEHSVDWSAFITKRINRPLKNSRAFLHTMRSKFAGVVLHGVGPQIWWDCQNPFPYALGIQDVYIPTDTEITLENLQYFSVRRKMRPGELFKLTYGRGKNRRAGWNMPAVRKILDSYRELNENPHNYDWSNNPEQMTELYKQNHCYYDGDSAPAIWFQDFFFRSEGEDGKEPGFYRRILLDKDNTAVNSAGDSDLTKFIFAPPKPFASRLDEIIHFQFGDGNNVPPFMYHSIRSLAYLLFEVLWVMNRLNCQFTQHVFEILMTWFQANDPLDRSRLEKILMSGPYAVIPEGLRVFTGQERYKADPQMVNLLVSQLKQKVGETSNAYTQQLDTGTQKERTKFEVQAIMSQISALMSSMLTLAYNQEAFAYREICRRFCLRPTHNFEAKKFQQDCKIYGIPEKYLDAERWEVIPEQVLGGGNKMLELAQARELREMRPTLNPNAQLEVDRIYITSLTDNPRLAEGLVPHAKGVSDAVHDAELAFGTLMQGIEVQVREGLNQIEQVATILRLMGQVVQRIGQTGGVGSPQDLVGLKTAAVYAAKLIGILAQNPDNKATVKQFQDALGNLMNMVKAFAQRQAEQSQKQNGNGAGQDPEAAAKVQGMVLQAKTKAAITGAAAQQKLRHAEQKFQQQQRLKQIGAMSDMRLDTGRALAETARKSMLSMSSPSGSAFSE